MEFQADSIACWRSEKIEKIPSDPEDQADKDKDRGFEEGSSQRGRGI